jgi:FAD/FMN-containing dehydrogenase
VAILSEDRSGLSFLAEVVTADGQLQIASATENSDLFWEIGGGGGNFGIVPSFEYQLQPLGPEELVFHPAPGQI